MNAANQEHGRRSTPANLLELLARIDWRTDLLSLLLVLAESALVYLITGFVLADPDASDAVLPAWIVVMLMVGGWLVPHLLDEWRVWSPEYEAITASSIVITLLVAVKAACFPSIAVWDIEWLRQSARALAFLPNDAVRPVWGIVGLAAYAWWRGRTRAEGAIDTAYTMLRAGTVGLTLLLVVILSAAEPDAQVRDRLSIATVFFFVCALAAIGVARLRLEGFRTSAPLGPRWLTTFVAPILAVVAVAIIGAGIFSRQFLDTVLWMLTPVFFVLAIVFQVFVLILAIIAFIILTPIVWLIGERELRLTPVTPTATTGNEQSLAERTGDSPFTMPDPLRYLIAALILFLVFSALTKFVFRRRRRERAATTEERESVLDWGSMFGSLADRLRGLRRRDEQDDPLAELRGDPRWRYTLAIRETYALLQGRGARAGRPRRPSETADEYRPPLASALPATSPAPASVATITERYDAARYSGTPASAEEAAAAERAWREVERG